MDKIIEYAHKLITEKVSKNDITLDLTAGKGNDSLFLAKVSKFVYSFDIQLKAINESKALTKDYKNIKFIHDSHEYINIYVKEKVKGAIFNLGYLPGGDKNITTKKTSTIKAIDEVLKLLLVEGRCVIVLYPGHEPGKLEADAVEDYVKKLPQKQFEVLKYQFINQINSPPYLLAIERVKV